MKRSFFDYLFVCHKMPSRSFFYKGKQFPICARCTGMFIGYFIGIATLIVVRPSIFISALFILPMLIDGTIQYKTNYESTNIRRLISGLLGGIAIILLTYHLIMMGISHGQWLSEHVIN